jgi:hypothetical protein
LAVRPKLSRVEWFALVLGLLIAHAFFVHEWLYPSSAHDAAQYVLLGREIAGRGLFEQFSSEDLRSYGYPLVVGVVERAAAACRVPFPVALFELQLGGYVAACLFLRHALSAISLPAARIAFCGTLVDFYALIYAPTSLTESLTLTLLVVTGGAWLVAYRANAIMWPLVAGSLAAGFGMMVRPANAFMVGAWILGVAVVALRRRPATPRAVAAGACVIAALALPMLPQLANNVRHFDRWTPLVVADLGKQQQKLGIENIKYATGMPPVPTAPIFYNSPLFADTEVHDVDMWHWYLEYPLRGIATLALHTFNMTDQDLLFTYSRDLDPWYRVPLGVINHGVVALGVLGLVLLGIRVRAAGDTSHRDAYLMLIVTLAGNWAVYAWTMVEMRYGSVILLGMFPLAGYAGIRIAGVSRGNAAVAGLGVAGYVVFALLLSDWVRQQAPVIREATAVAGPPLSAIPTLKR